MSVPLSSHQSPSAAGGTLAAGGALTGSCGVAAAGTWVAADGSLAEPRRPRPVRSWWLPRLPAPPAPAPATPPASARPARSARRCAGAAPGSPLRSPPPAPAALFRGPPRWRPPGRAARHRKPRPVGGDGGRAARCGLRGAAALRGRRLALPPPRLLQCPTKVRGGSRCAWLRAPEDAPVALPRALARSGGAAATSRGADSAATTGASIAGGSMNSVYSRRIVASQPAWSVRRTTGSFTGRALVTTSAVPAAERSTLTRPNRTCGTPSASRSAATILKHSDATSSPSPSVTGTTTAATGRARTAA